MTSQSPTAQLHSNLPVTSTMPEKPATPDKIAHRLVQILSRLNDGKKLNPDTLVTEFGVSARTIQRDLKLRFKFLKLQKTDGLYHLPAGSLGKLSVRDVENFAALAGVGDLFPAMSEDFLSDIFNSRIKSPLLVKGPHYEDLAGKEAMFSQLEQAIQGCHKVRYDYSKAEGTKTYLDIEPYKLINHDGIWYLAGKDGDKLKAFTFTKIKHLRVLEASFKPDPKVQKQILEDDDIWLNAKKIEVVLKISAEVASYFKRRKLVASQVIEKELEGGGLIVSCKVAHLNQIVPTVRYWLPHIRIISPEGAQAEMESQMHDYLSADKKHLNTASQGSF